MPLRNERNRYPVQFVRLSATAQMPVYSTEGSAAMDLFADDRVYIAPHQARQVPINIAIELPPNMMALVLPRSGLALKRGITLLNSPGLIDPDYRGALSALMFNTSNEDYYAEPGDRVAQLVIAPFERVDLDQSDRLSTTNRGAGGWGSTGFR
jgi:dUTP pyrophosphatase